MPDDKRGREKQARDADRRQRERDVAAELERWHETEPTVDAEDLGDWILAAIREDERLPDSRGVRRRAADYCRDQGYQVGNNEWLGVRAGPGAPGGMRRLLRR